MVRVAFPGLHEAVEALVHLGVHAAHEEARHARHAGDRAAGLQAVLEPREIRVDHAPVRFDREEQRDVDVDAVGDERAHRDYALGRAGHLDHDVRTGDGLPEPVRFLDGRLGIVCRARRHLDGDEAVTSLRGVVHGPEDVARGANVVGLDELEHFPRRLVAYGSFELGIVGGALRERLLEDRRIRRHARECVARHAPGELAVAQHRAVDVVEPDRLAGGVKILQRVRHRQFGLMVTP